MNLKQTNKVIVPVVAVVVAFFSGYWLSQSPPPKVTTEAKVEKCLNDKGFSFFRKDAKILGVQTHDVSNGIQVVSGVYGVVKDHDTALRWAGSVDAVFFGSTDSVKVKDNVVYLGKLHGRLPSPDVVACF